MHKFLLFVVFIAFSANLLNAQNYYAESDKRDLRNFLIQNSAEKGKINGNILGLSSTNLNLLLTDSNWISNENWVSTLNESYNNYGLTWNAETPKRIIVINWYIEGSLEGSLSGDLDLSNCTKLLNINFYGNQLTNLDVSNCTELFSLECHSNNLTNLDVSNNIKLTYLKCSENNLTNLDLSNNIDLKNLECWENNLTNLDLSNNTQLTELWCNENQLENLDVSKNILLKQLVCYSNYLTFSGLLLPNQKILNCFYAPQKRINLGHFPADEVDLTKEFNINNKITNFKWFDNSTELTEGIDYENNSGMFIFSDNFIDKKLICKATNESFPDFKNDSALTFEIILDEKVGIEEDKFHFLTIYPNPSSEKLMIDNGENIIKNISIFDISGRLIDSYVVENTTFTIDISAFQIGTYFFNIDGKIEKFVVNK